MGYRVHRLGVVSAGLMVLAAAAGGCTGPDFTEITGAEFDQQVLRADRPVMVDFYKEGCPTCGLVEGTMNQLKKEYGDRVKFVRFLTMTGLFQAPSPEIKDRYDIRFFPTVILFAGGQERYRWSLDYSINDYRKGLDEVAPKPAATATPAKSS